jgi:hypothetical protein
MALPCMSTPTINLADIAATITSETGYPLMFGFKRAFGQTCRWDP